MNLILPGPLVDQIMLHVCLDILNLRFCHVSPPTLVRKGTFMTRLQNQLQDIAGPPSALQRLEMDGPAVEIVVESSGRLSRASQFFESYPAASFVIHPLR